MKNFSESLAFHFNFYVMFQARVLCSLFVCKPQTKLKSILDTVPRHRMFIVVRILIRHFSSHGHFVD